MARSASPPCGRRRELEGRPDSARPLRLHVLRSERLSPHFVRATLGGGDIAHFRPMGHDQWFRLFLPAGPDAVASLGRIPDRLGRLSYLKLLGGPKGTRPVLRNYTVRAHRAARRRGHGRPRRDLGAHLCTRRHGRPPRRRNRFQPARARRPSRPGRRRVGPGRRAWSALGGSGCTEGTRHVLRLLETLTACAWWARCNSSRAAETGAGLRSDVMRRR
ncbi:siderophore-interacting protein [Streptomyces fractus]|uniref:siderophore-interacting protein n=1 Tax=Streptomyces fractus TaxID=641806 RepID=UPI003CE822E3